MQIISHWVACWVPNTTTNNRWLVKGNSQSKAYLQDWGKYLTHYQCPEHAWSWMENRENWFWAFGLMSLMLSVCVYVASINVWATTCKINSITLRQDNHLIHLNSGIPYPPYWMAPVNAICDSLIAKQQRSTMMKQSSWIIEKSDFTESQSLLLLLIARDFGSTIFKQNTQQVSKFALAKGEFIGISKLLWVFIR